MELPPFGPRRDHARDEVKLLAPELSPDRLARRVDPQGSGLFVVQDEGVLVENAFVAEGEGPPVNDPAIHDSRLAQRSPGNGDRLPPAGIVS